MTDRHPVVCARLRRIPMTDTGHGSFVDSFEFRSASLVGSELFSSNEQLVRTLFRNELLDETSVFKPSWCIIVVIIIILYVRPKSWKTQNKNSSCHEFIFPRNKREKGKTDRNSNIECYIIRRHLLNTRRNAADSFSARFRLVQFCFRFIYLFFFLFFFLFFSQSSVRRVLFTLIYVHTQTRAKRITHDSEIKMYFSRFETADRNAETTPRRISARPYNDRKF